MRLAGVKHAMLEPAGSERIDGYDPGLVLQPRERRLEHPDRVADARAGVLGGSVLVALGDRCLQVGIAVEQRTVPIEYRLAALPELATDVLAADLDVGDSAAGVVDALGEL